jgi:hypothetical protein
MDPMARGLADGLVSVGPLGHILGIMQLRLVPEVTPLVRGC